MTNAQKSNVWLAALNAAKLGDVKFGTLVLIASDVAKSLGLVFQHDEKGFELCRKVSGSAYPAGGVIARFAA